MNTQTSLNTSRTATPVLSCRGSWSLGVLAIGLTGLSLWTLPARADRDNDQDRDRNSQGHGGPLVAAPGSHAYGKSLAGWLSVYWRWNLGGQDEASSVVNGVKLIPLPVGELISGTGTPEDPSLYRGQVELTIDDTTPFVLPLAAWTTEVYNNGTPEDASFSDELFLGAISPHFTIDNRLVISDCNEQEFYVPRTAFRPPVVYAAPSSYGSIGATTFQSVGVVGRPLPVGVHRIHLYEPYIVPGMFGTIFDNTWVITVKKSNRH